MACPHCGGAVAAGYAAVALEGGVTPLFWVAGALEREADGGARVQVRERAPMLALRCTRCAQVTFAAPPPHASGGA